MRKPFSRPTTASHLSLRSAYSFFYVQLVHTYMMCMHVPEALRKDPEDFGELLVSNYAAGTSSVVNAPGLHFLTFHKPAHTHTPNPLYNTSLSCHCCKQLRRCSCWPIGLFAGARVMEARSPRLISFGRFPNSVHVASIPKTVSVTFKQLSDATA